MKRIIPILIAILICFSVGCTASYFQSESILNWYPALEKPSCTPPDIAFPIACKGGKTKCDKLSYST